MADTKQLHVVIAGGGVAALETVLALKALAGELVRVTMVSGQAEFEIKALRTAEPFLVDRVSRFPLEQVAADQGFSFVLDHVVEIDPAGHKIELAEGGELAYDALVLATGARTREPFPHVRTFASDQAPRELAGVLADLEEGYSHSMAFVVPTGVSWPLPAYELALMTAMQVRGMGIDKLRLMLITPERTPLAMFGEAASQAVADLLEAAGVEFKGDADPRVVRKGHVEIGDEDIAVDRILALPLLDGLRLPGVPHDHGGFVPIDDFGRVFDVKDVYAAGDGTNFPMKQGGLACQQADAVASAIAAAAGAGNEPEPFRPVLQGKLLTGRGEQFLRHETDADGKAESEASDLKLWDPPAKVSGRFLSVWLAAQSAEADAPPAAPPQEEHVEIEVPMPSPSELRRDAMSIDPYGPMLER